MHCPVPLSAQGKLERYFKPIKSLLPILRENKTELFFGLVHAGKIDITRDMVQVSCETLEGFSLELAQSVVGEEYLTASLRASSTFHAQFRSPMSSQLCRES